MHDSTQEYGRGNGTMMGFVIGAAVGAGLALLFAPSSGVETRRRLGQTANRLRTRVGEGVDITKERIGDLSSGVKGRIGDLKHEVGAAVVAGREAFVQDREARRTERT